MSKLNVCWLLLLCACGRAPVQDPAFIPYLIAFEEQYRGFGVTTTTIDIEFYPTLAKQNELGECELHQDKIEISRQYWSNLSDISKQNLIYHELGHCIFNRVHVDTTYLDGCPTSIMNTYLLTDNCFLAHKDALLAELPFQTPQ